MAQATLIPLDSIDPALVEEVLDAAFGADRHGRTAYAIREGVDWLPALSFAAIDEAEHIVGTIQCWPVALTDPQGRPHPLIMVGPVAVLPAEQDRGYGKAMMAATLGAIDLAAPLPQVMIGDPAYYGQWGFSSTHTGNWQVPGPCERERLLVRAENPATLPREGTLGPWRG